MFTSPQQACHISTLLKLAITVILNTIVIHLEHFEHRKSIQFFIYHAGRTHTVVLFNTQLSLGPLNIHFLNPSTHNIVLLNKRKRPLKLIRSVTNTTQIH